MADCSKCGKELGAEAKYCIYCGTVTDPAIESRLPDEPEAQPEQPPGCLFSLGGGVFAFILTILLISINVLKVPPPSAAASVPAFIYDTWSATYDRQNQPFVVEDEPVVIITTEPVATATSTATVEISEAETEEPPQVDESLQDVKADHSSNPPSEPAESEPDSDGQGDDPIPDCFWVEDGQITNVNYWPDESSVEFDLVFSEGYRTEYVPNECEVSANCVWDEWIKVTSSNGGEDLIHSAFIKGKAGTDNNWIRLFNCDIDSQASQNLHCQSETLPPDSYLNSLLGVYSPLCSLQLLLTSDVFMASQDATGESQAESDCPNIDPNVIPNGRAYYQNYGKTLVLDITIPMSVWDTPPIVAKVWKDLFYEEFKCETYEGITDRVFCYNPEFSVNLLSDTVDVALYIDSAMKCPLPTFTIQNIPPRPKPSPTPELPDRQDKDDCDTEWECCLVAGGDDQECCETFGGNWNDDDPENPFCER